MRSCAVRDPAWRDAVAQLETALARAAGPDYSARLRLLDRLLFPEDHGPIPDADADAVTPASSARWPHSRLPAGERTAP